MWFDFVFHPSATISLNISCKVICCNSIKKILNQLRKILASGPCFCHSAIFWTVECFPREIRFLQSSSQTEQSNFCKLPCKRRELRFRFDAIYKISAFSFNSHLWSFISLLFDSSHCPHCICWVAMFLILILTQWYLYLYMVVFLTGLPDFQYQNEKTCSANEELFYIENFVKN